VEREIGGNFASNFNLSMRPVAAASLGQVYTVNYQGQKLAVKIKRPGAKLTIALDFFLIRQAATLIDSIGRKFFLFSLN
jgi:predicted unusual protein kinase regulating ubiquinone biosynthesis (AarF/ABC1/UbiB family)